MPAALLARDVMRIGVPTCKPGDPISQLAAQMLEHGWTALVVMDDEGDARGWLNEQLLAAGYARLSALTPDACPLTPDHSPLTAADIMDEHVPDGPADVPLAAIVQLMADMGVDHMFFMHHAGGRTWPASMLNLRDVVKALAGPEHIKNQGMHAARPTPMDLFRQRYGLAKK